MLKILLTQPLFNLLLIIYAFVPGNDFGIAVIILTVIVRLLLWPLVKKQLYQQKVMRDLQPEIAKVKAKAKGNREQEAKMMVELFKEKEINPFSSFGLILIQFPVLIALFFVLQHVLNPADVQSEAYAFVRNLGPVQAIIMQPQNFHPTLLGLIDMTKPSLLLAGAAGLTQFWQARQLTPRDTTKSDPAKAMAFNMSLLLPVITVVFAARFPAALALYWTFTSLIAVLQQHWVLQEDVALMQRLGIKKAVKSGK